MAIHEHFHAPAAPHSSQKLLVYAGTELLPIPRAATQLPQDHNSSQPLDTAKNTKQKGNDRLAETHQLTGRFGIRRTSGVPGHPPGWLGHPYLEPPAVTDGVKPRAYSYKNLLRNSFVLMCCRKSFSSSSPISGHNHNTAPQKAPGEAHSEVQTHFLLSGT